MEITLTDQNFSAELAKSPVPVLVDFWATWCPPCKMLSPIVEEIAEEYQGKLTVGTMDVDQNPHTATQFGIMSIPTLIVFKNGQPVKQMVGYQPKESLAKKIDEILQS